METRSADLPRIDAPVLIVHGTEDRILSFESVSQRRPALVEDARLVQPRADRTTPRETRPDELDDAHPAFPGE